MASFQIIVGSMLGGTEYIAEACEETLNSFGHQVELHLQPKLEQISSNNQTWLVCTSTHGAGEFPDNIQAFIAELSQKQIDLSTTKFFIIGAGDSSYDTFCLAAKNIENILITKGCKKSLELFTIDMQEDIDPEEEAQRWITNNKEILS